MSTERQEAFVRHAIEQRRIAHDLAIQQAEARRVAAAKLRAEMAARHQTNIHVLRPVPSRQAGV